MITEDVICVDARGCEMRLKVVWGGGWGTLPTEIQFGNRALLAFFWLKSGGSHASGIVHGMHKWKPKTCNPSMS